MRPAFLRPHPSLSATELSAWPGTVQTPTVTCRSPTVILTRSLFSTPSALAVAGERMAALSHTSFVTGSGISCSQVLFAWKPSTILGHGANVTSSEPGPTLAGG